MGWPLIYLGLKVCSGWVGLVTTLLSFDGKPLLVLHKLYDFAKIYLHFGKVRSHLDLKPSNNALL